MILARLKLWAAGFGLVIAALAASWLGGRKSAQADAKVKGLEDYVDTRKRMDEVVTDSDPAVLRDWLRERGKQRGDL